jgi:hypothetical protein
MFHGSVTVFYSLVFFNFINLFFKMLMYYSSADLCGGFRLKGKSRKTFDFVISAKSVFFLISVLRGFGRGATARQPPHPGAPLLKLVFNYTQFLHV